HLSSGTETRVVGEAMGLDDEQVNMLHFMETGAAIVRTAGGYLEPYPVKIYNFRESVLASARYFDQCMKTRKSQLYKESEINQGYLLESAKEVIPKPLRSSLNYEMRLTSSSNQESKSTDFKNTDLESCLPVLRVWLSLQCPFLTQGEIFEKAGIRSGSTQARIKRAMLRQSLIIEHKLQVGKTFASVWEPTTKCYEDAGISQSRHKSKGGYLH